MSRSRLPVAVVVGAPLAMLLLGAGVGWFTRADADRAGDGDSVETAATVVGITLPASLDAVAPQQPLSQAATAVVVDPTSIIGFVPADGTSGAIAVPPGAALDLPLTPGGAATAVDPDTRDPFTVATPDAALPPAPTISGSLPPVAAPASTLPPPDDVATTATVPAGIVPFFVDPCTADLACAGAPGVVREVVSDRAARVLEALRVSFPVPAAAGYAALCDSVEAGNVPDAILTPATRPTVAVLVNQPSTLALTGTWADGTALPKTTMVTSSAHDAEWQRAWDQDGVQRNIIACITLPLDDVRAHAAGGVAELRADVLAISATGRADTTGQLALDVPTDDDDPLFAERLTINDRGDQLGVDGVLVPTVHVHYALLADTALFADLGLDPAGVHVYEQHAFVEGADCSGWAANQQGRDRTAATRYTVTSEQRTVAGRVRNVTIVDGDVSLDRTMPSGWQGQFCVRLTAVDAPLGGVASTVGDGATLALRGVSLRGPRTADYAVGVALDGTGFPAEWQLRTEWRSEATGALCVSASLSSDGSAEQRDATCAASARVAPEGMIVTLTARDPAGEELPLMAIRVPVNTAYCNLDDPYGYLADGCSTGFSLPRELPLATGPARGAPESVRVVLQVSRTAVAGALWRDPSHAWAIGPLTSFAL